MSSDSKHTNSMIFFKRGLNDLLKKKIIWGSSQKSVEILELTENEQELRNIEWVVLHRNILSH